MDDMEGGSALSELQSSPGVEMPLSGGSQIQSLKEN